MPPKARGKKRTRVSSSSEASSSSPNAPTTKPPPRKIPKQAPRSPSPGAKESSGSDEIPLRSKSKPQTTAGPATKTTTTKSKSKAKVGRRQQDSNEAFKKSDIATGGIRFVDQVTPPQLIRKNNLTNLQRFNAVINRLNARVADTTEDTGSKDDDANEAGDVDPAGPRKTPVTQALQQSTSAAKPSKLTTAKDALASSTTSVTSQGQLAANPQSKTKTPRPGLVASDSASAQAAQARVQQQASTGATSLDFILQGPVVDNRNYEFAVSDGATNGWALLVRYKVISERAQGKYLEVMKIMAQKAKYSKTEAESIAKMLARFCARWPFPIGGSDGRFKSNLLAVFSFELYPAKGFDLRAMRLKKQRYNFIINIIDPTTGKASDEETSLSPDEFKSLTKTIPPLPKYVTTATDDSKLGTIDSDAKRNAIKFMKFVAWSFHGKIISSDEFQKAYGDLQHEYTGSYGFLVGNIKNVERNQKSGVVPATTPVIPAAKRIFAIRRDNANYRVTILPTPAFLQTVNKQLEDVFLKSLSRGRLAFVTDAINKCQEDNPTDPLKAWRAGVVAADAMNEAAKRGDPPPSQCKCENEQVSSITSHQCLACLQSVLCSTMQPDENGEPVCAKCALKDSRGAEHKLARLAQRRLKQALRAVIGREVRHWSSSADGSKAAIKKAKKAMVTATFDEICRGITNKAEVPDAYVKRLLVSKTRGSGQMDPFSASIDAVFPYGSYDGERRLHAPNNTVTTSLWANYTKHAFLPAVLAVLAKFINQDPADQDIEDLLKFMDDIYRCNRVLSYHKKQRLSAPLDPVEHAQHLKMWRTAIPPRILDTGARKLYKYASFNLMGEDTDSFIDKQRLLKIVKQIEKKFNKRCSYAEDGCPWISLAETMPKDWCWGNCWSLFAERQQREWDSCNRNFEQVDVPETLFLEAIWQFCDPGYVEFLGLPLVAWWVHALRFTIGKKDHRRGMRTGWRTIRPTSIEDRDETLNNVLFETCTSNFLKNNFLDADLIQIRQELAKTVVPEAYFDSELRDRLLGSASSVDDSFEVDDIDEVDDENEDCEDTAGGRIIDIDRILSGEEDTEEDDDDCDNDLDEMVADNEGGDTHAEPRQETLLTELDDDEQMAAVKDLEGDVHRMARETVHQARSYVSGALSNQELIRSAACGNMDMRLASMKSDNKHKVVDILISTVVKNRIVQGVGVWADHADEQDEDEEMLLRD